jgi:hypothetical protein
MVIGLGVSWLSKARLRGDGPVFLKLGRKVLYREADLIAWRDERLRRSTSEYRSGCCA